MSPALFADLLESVHEAVEHARGRLELRTTIFPGPPAPMSGAEVRALRESLNASQAVFAIHLNVSTKLVQAWEADRRQPAGAALRLLHLTREKPALVFQGISSSMKRRDDLSSRHPVTRSARRRKPVAR